MTPLVLVIFGTAIGLSGVVIGRAYERRAWVRARPGYLIQPATPAALVENWCCPGKPYDQSSDEGLTPIATEPLASLGNPLIPDPVTLATNAAITATQAALDRDNNYSRRVP